MSAKRPTLRDRASGVLLHATSLPCPHGCGDLGEEARRFADFLASAGQGWWQMLPVGPAGYGDSPYSALSAFAGNPLLVDIDALGVPVDAAELPLRHVDYAAAHALRERHLRRAFEAFRPGQDAEEFQEREAAWLEDYALFAALKRAHGGRAWTEWERGVRLREPGALARAARELARDVAFERFVQLVFDRQWRELRAYCTALGISLMGDLPIFVAHDSADVWQHREMFELDAEGTPTHVAGVPPDYFSATGQRWGNPLYRWDRLAATGYAWWVERLRHALARFDAVRLDHFIGFVRCWRIAASEPTAIHGAWRPGPGRALFDRLREEIGDLPLVAEDLGAVTREVTRLRRELGLPGIRLLEFAFGSDPQARAFLPHAHARSSVVYTGTHDNDTVVGWFFDPGGGPDSTRTPGEAEAERRRALAYVGKAEPIEIHWDIIRLAMASVARTAMVPMQDLLGLGSEARMNRPGKPSGNWRWRMLEDEASPALAARLLAMTRTYGRAARSPTGGRAARSPTGERAP